MPYFALHDGNLVHDVIVADSLAHAQELTELNVLETDGEPWVLWTMEEDGWRKPKPFNSWIWEGSDWFAPVPYPSDFKNYEWNEDSLSWDEIIDPQPYPSWVLDELNNWVPPTPYPNDGKRYSWDEDSTSWVIFE